MRRFKISRGGSKKFISSALALQLVFGALALSSCSDKEVEETEQEITTEEVVEDNTFEETVKKIKALNLDLSDKSIKDSTLVLLLSVLAKEDENGKVNADEISKYVNHFDRDAVLEGFDNLLSEVETQMLKGNFVSVSGVLPEEMSADKTVLKEIEAITKEALDNKDNKEIVSDCFVKIYKLFVSGETVDGFEIDQMDYSTRAVAYSYAREVMFLARNYVSDEDYERIDKRTNDQYSRSELVIKLEKLENDFVEVSDGKAVAMFQKRYEQFHDVLIAKVKSSNDVQKLLVNYINIKYLLNEVTTKDRNEIIGSYTDEDLKAALELIDAIILYNAETYGNNKDTNNLISLSKVMIDNTDNDRIALDYVTKSCMEVLNLVNEDLTYDALELNGYYDLLCACTVEQDEYKYIGSDGKENTIKFNWHEMSDGVKLVCFEMINFTFSRMPKKVKDNSIFNSYYEVSADMLFRNVQFFQDTLDDCKPLDKTEYVKTK